MTITGRSFLWKENILVTRGQWPRCSDLGVPSGITGYQWPLFNTYAWKINVKFEDNPLNYPRGNQTRKMSYSVKRSLTYLCWPQLISVRARHCIPMNLRGGRRIFLWVGPTWRRSHAKGTPKTKTHRVWPTKKYNVRFGVPASSWRAMVRGAGPWGPDSSCGGLIRLAGPWHVLRSPDSFCGALISPAAPWFVLRGSASSTGARFVLRGPTSSCRPSSVSRGPALSRGALIRLAGPWFVMRALIRRSGPWSVPRGPDSYCEALIRSVVPDLSRRALICLAEPWFVLRAHPAGPGFVL